MKPDLTEKALFVERVQRSWLPFMRYWFGSDDALPNFDREAVNEIWDNEYPKIVAACRELLDDFLSEEGNTRKTWYLYDEVYHGTYARHQQSARYYVPFTQLLAVALERYYERKEADDDADGPC